MEKETQTVTEETEPKNDAEPEPEEPTPQPDKNQGPKRRMKLKFDPNEAIRNRKAYSWKGILQQIFSLREDTADYPVMRERIHAGGQITGTNLAVLMMAILIASVGLNMNSTAVIIGAMLVSPLMGTIQLIALGTATVDLQQVKKAAIGLTIQVLVALLTSTLYFALSPISTATSELLARTSPTIYDVLIATAGGVAGIIGITRKDASNNVIPGVAIATALMPPLCTCGYCIAHGHWMMLAGAAYLFVINAFFIFLSATVILMILEVPVVGEINPDYRKRIRRGLIRNAIIILIPSILLGVTLVKKSNSSDTASAAPVTSKTESTADVTKQLEILYPEINSVQIGQLEKTGSDSKTKTQNIMLIGVSSDLTDSQKNTLEKFVDTIYDEDYTIIYGDAKDMIGTSTSGAATAASAAESSTTKAEAAKSTSQAAASATVPAETASASA